MERLIVVLSQQRRCRQDLQRHSRAVNLTVDIASQIERDLLHTSLQFLLFQAGQLMEREQRNAKQWQCKGDAK